MEENRRVLEALERLAKSLSELDDKKDDVRLSHWRQVPSDLSTAYELMQNGAELIRATSTKYTLVGKIDEQEGSKIAKDLQRGCELVGTGALIIHNDDMGCNRSARHYCKQAARSVLATTIALVTLFLDHEAALEENVAAQKTGAVWSACELVAKVPKGNRASMRRDLLLWTRDCNETFQEFTEMIELGPALTEEADSDQKQADASWDDFCGGASDEQYSVRELPVAQACVALVKCSRGSMNVAIQACECAGEAVATAEEEAQKGLLAWISTVHNKSRAVGQGMTDLGTLLYPPIDLKDKSEEGDHVTRRVEMQRDAIVSLHEFVLDASPEGVGSLELTQDIAALATKLRAAAIARCEEAHDAIAKALTER